MLKISIALISALFLPCAAAFVPHQVVNRAPHSPLFLADGNGDTDSLSRRDILQTAFSGGTVAALTFLSSSPAQAEEEADASPVSSSQIKNVVVAGATGQTGSRIFARLIDQSFETTGGVRNTAKATKSLGKANGDKLKRLDVVEDSLDDLVATLNGADGLIIACGMNPGKNLLRMSAAAREVDNVGTCKLIDAAKQANVKKVVMVSSILTNGRAWGQEDSPGFKITNAFGNALDEKLVAEKYLRASGLDYTIVRPGGLKVEAPVGGLSVNAEDTLNSGEISRDLVADVCVASLNDPKTTNKVLEIIEDNGPPRVFNGIM
eukprot:CAMPEP_0204619284 /NCGR_PEP_ID=MMETSP0717-20131115/5707_1 /ASSEMBLY_ACC=CAM_ASM_000666 /TAXON_ID=230516 /ORGANISM="Chaetoceros curvisetus" /LENGTH=319 /DNA_ID=CAMNT_0051633255 /DNA_START=36 /DNA_END=995 /DNA_ORIENTATION=-